jgi:hypothetical protein
MYPVNTIAVPLPAPTPVAINDSPSVLDVAPIKVKSVVPIVFIVYVLPTSKI